MMRLYFFRRRRLLITSPFRKFSQLGIWRLLHFKCLLQQVDSIVKAEQGG